mmetsp:Transcript_21147/g.58717  ORF Transcript_21147/g.58717 Transcript_21147/m.58717 type:complete len:300 (-) Transcript_21147:1327-2226(-)
MGVMWKEFLQGIGSRPHACQGLEVVHVHQGGHNHAGSGAPNAHLAVEDHRIITAPLHHGFHHGIKISVRWRCAVCDRHSHVFDSKALMRQAAVHIGRGLHGIWVVDLLPCVKQLAIVPALKGLMRHQDMAAVPQRLSQHILLQTLLHGLQARSIDACILHHILQRPHLLPQHKRFPVDVHHRLLAHVHPQRMHAPTCPWTAGAAHAAQHSAHTLHGGHAHTIDGHARDTPEVGSAWDGLRDLGALHAREVVLLQDAEGAQHRTCARGHHILVMCAQAIFIHSPARNAVILHRPHHLVTL